MRPCNGYHSDDYLKVAESESFNSSSCKICKSDSRLNSKGQKTRSSHLKRRGKLVWNRLTSLEEDTSPRVSKTRAITNPSKSRQAKGLQADGEAGAKQDEQRYEQTLNRKLKLFITVKFFKNFTFLRRCYGRKEHIYHCKIFVRAAGQPVWK